MQRSGPSRRTFLKATAAVASVGAATSLSGCQGGDGGSGDGGSGDGGSGDASPSQRTAAVPARANGVAYLDFQQFVEDDNIRQVINASLEADASAGGPTNVEEALEQAQQQEGLDPNEVQDMVMFGEIPESGVANASQSEYVGGILWSDLSTDEVLTAIQEDSSVTYTEETHNGQTLLVAEGSASGSVQAYGVLGEGDFATGSVEAVKDAIDVSAGSADALGGEVKSAFEATRSAPMRFAAALPEEESSQSTEGGMGGGGMGAGGMDQITTVSGSILYSNGSNLGLEFNLIAESTDAATQMEQSFNQMVEMMKQSYEQQQSEQSQQALQMLNKLSIGRSDATVSITYEDSVSNIEAAIESSGSGMIGMPMGGA